MRFEAENDLFGRLRFEEPKTALDRRLTLNGGGRVPSRPPSSRESSGNGGRRSGSNRRRKALAFGGFRPSVRRRRSNSRLAARAVSERAPATIRPPRTLFRRVNDQNRPCESRRRRVCRRRSARSNAGQFPRVRASRRRGKESAARFRTSKTRRVPFARGERRRRGERSTRRLGRNGPNLPSRDGKGPRRQKSRELARI